MHEDMCVYCFLLEFTCHTGHWCLVDIYNHGKSKAGRRSKVVITIKDRHIFLKKWNVLNDDGLNGMQTPVSTVGQSRRFLTGFEPFIDPFVLHPSRIEQFLMCPSSSSCSIRQSSTLADLTVYGLVLDLSGVSTADPLSWLENCC